MNLISISENKEKFSWEDFDTWIKISKISERFIRVPNTLGSIWVGPENISNLERQILKLREEHKNLINLLSSFVETANINEDLFNKSKSLTLKILESKKIIKML